MITKDLSPPAFNRPRGVPKNSLQDAPLQQTSNTTVIIVSLILAGLAIAASYYAFTYGLNAHEVAVSTEEFVNAGAFIYFGVVGAIVAFGNLVIAFNRSCGNKRSGNIGTQILFSIGSPILFLGAGVAMTIGIPCACAGKLCEVLKSK